MLNSKFRIGVIGDAIIDEYFSVHVKNISPEFPIPVMQSFTDKPRACPGGAANVAHQFTHFNVEASLISFLDENSKLQLIDCGINVENCLIIKSNIPRKRRFYSDNFPTYRWDVEQDNYGLNEEGVSKACLDLYELNDSKIVQFDALIFSDYCKGVFSKNLFNFIPKTSISVVDSKSKNIEKWKGCTVFKPNYREAVAFSGLNNIVDAGVWIQNKLQCRHVVITNAEKGVTIVSSPIEGNKDLEIQEIKPDQDCDQAVSVVGAGDCFTAMLTLSLLEGLNISQAADIAWNAGLIYVKKKYNSPISPLDLIKNKFVENVSHFKNRSFKLVFTNGCFDLLHRGHIENLKFAKSKGDKLVVALNTDESISRIKKGRPLQSLEDRIKIISSLEMVDYIVTFSEDTPLNVIKEIQPDTIVKGSEYLYNEIVGSDIAKETLCFPMVDGASTTNLIKKIISTSSLVGSLGQKIFNVGNRILTLGEEEND